ncbi:MAG: cytochrome c biogenesis protein CcdA [Acidimicrobiia bacterium]|nr:cytochrome c biogenesis protein CcdA [Acidimicrobiia bacterium]MDH4309178.1 cytochrome c biogenesis protein CcdA [Acidimicrobiia bacterium]
MNDTMDFSDSSYLIQLALAFGGGILAFISPCVLPLLPGYLGLMSGYSVSSLQGGEVSRSRMLRVTLLFVLGFSVVFVATGALATRLSGFLARNQAVTERVAGTLILVFGVLMIGMALSNRGLFGVLQRERRMEVRPSRLGAWAPPVMGLAFGFGWTPCIGPILGGVLAVAATQDTVGQGMLLLFMFSLGLGVPFVLSGLGLSKAFGAIKGFRKWMRPVNIAGGLIMATFGILMVTGNVAWLSARISEFFQAVPFLEKLSEI